MTSEEWKAVKDLRDCMADFRDFCRKQMKPMSGCCGDPEAECPIAMGEWWDEEMNEKLKRVSNLLFPDAKC